MEIWVNPSCSKCRAATSALDEAGVAYTVRRYLDDPPTADELAAVLDRLGMEPWHVARPKESREAGIDLPQDAEHRDDWLAAMVANPIVIQRPILTADDGPPWSAATRTRWRRRSPPSRNSCAAPAPHGPALARILRPSHARRTTFQPASAGLKSARPARAHTDGPV